MRQLLISLTILAALVVAAPVMATEETRVTEKEVCVTQYGGATECKKEKVVEEVKHKETVKEVVHTTVDAGIGDNLLLMAGVVALLGLGLKGAAYLTEQL